MRFAEQIDRAYAERERHDAGQRFNDGYYSEFVPDPRHSGPIARGWIKQGGGLLAADSPLLSSEMRELLRAAGCPSSCRRISASRRWWRSRRRRCARPTPVPGAWHQDGKFMGDVNALNLWLSLSRCGDLAPGLDLVPRRLEHYAATATDDAMFDNMVSQRMAEQEAGATGILRPIFEPGDGLLFDELFLHKTGSEPDMSQPRFAIENWFFGASGFPADYVPLTV